MPNNVCHICQQQACVETPLGLGAIWITCSNCGQFLIDEDVFIQSVSNNIECQKAVLEYLVDNGKHLNGENIVPGFYFAEDKEFSYQGKTIRPITMKSLVALQNFC